MKLVRIMVLLMLATCFPFPAFASRSGPDPLYNFLNDGGSITIRKSGTACQVRMVYRHQMGEIEYDEDCEYKDIPAVIRRGAYNSLRILYSYD